MNDYFNLDYKLSHKICFKVMYDFVLSLLWPFQNLATEDNRDILQEVYKTGSTIKRIKDIHSANAITYLLDSTLATQCVSSSSSSSSESLEDQLRGENPTKIWQLQLQMMAIISAMSGSTKTFPVQFNENAAW